MKWVKKLERENFQLCMLADKERTINNMLSKLFKAKKSIAKQKL